MAIFGIKTYPEVDKYMMDSHERLQSGINFFEGNIKKLQSKGGDSYYLLILEPVVPKVYYMGFIWVALYLLTKGFIISWWLLPGVLVSLTCIFWNRYFYFYCLKWAMKQKGYYQEIDIVKPVDILRHIGESI